MASLGLLGAAAVAGIGTAPAAGAPEKTTVVVATETDFHIALSKKTFSPGHYIFVAKNKGQTTHGIEITGPGLSDAESRLIEPGQTTRLTVTLKQGRYDLFCQVPGHKQLGMNVNFAVRG